MDNKPFISIIITTFNRGSLIISCMNALLKQDYPKNKFEIIIVDDGSTDNTTEIISKYKVKLVRHLTNLGIASGRNTGIKNAKGELIAITDDDSIPRSNWLEQLSKPYINNDIIGVGGLVIPLSRKTIMEKYLYETGYGNPAPIEFGKSKNIFYRFGVYIIDMFKPVKSKRGIIQVQNIYTSNASFRKKVLDSVGGFDENLKSSEDTDICTRIYGKYFSKKIVFNKKAITINKYHTSFLIFLSQTFKRSKHLLYHYNKNNKFPPIFPFPIFILLIIILISIYNILYTIPAFILLTQVFYPWWLIKYFKQNKRYFLIFPYMQFSLELVTILGILFSAKYLLFKKINIYRTNDYI